MLKIKDNVDLKELEKYGFIEDEFKVRLLYEQNRYTGLRVEKETKKIGLYNSVDIVVEKRTLDILYDLIKDGLVEKVEDK